MAIVNGGAGGGGVKVKNTKEVVISGIMSKYGFEKGCFVSMPTLNESYDGTIATKGVRISSCDKQYSGFVDPVCANMFCVNDKWAVCDLESYYWFMGGGSGRPYVLVSFPVPQNYGDYPTSFKWKRYIDKQLYSTTAKQEISGFCKFASVSENAFMVIYRVPSKAISGKSTLFGRICTIEDETGEITMGSEVTIFQASELSTDVTYNITYDLHVEKNTGSKVRFVVTCAESYASKLSVLVGTIEDGGIGVDSITVLDTDYSAETTNTDCANANAAHKLCSVGAGKYVLFSSYSVLAKGSTLAFSVDFEENSVTVLRGKAAIADKASSGAMFAPFQITDTEFIVIHFGAISGVSKMRIFKIQYSGNYAECTITELNFPGDGQFTVSPSTRAVELMKGTYAILQLNGWRFYSYSLDYLSDAYSPVSNISLNPRPCNLLNTTFGTVGFTYRYTDTDGSFRTCEMYIHSNWNVKYCVEEAFRHDFTSVMGIAKQASSTEPEFSLEVTVPDGFEVNL